MNYSIKRNRIRNWQTFGKKVRRNGCQLLKCIDNFFLPILVTGCQRSGTTLLSRILRHSEGFEDFQTGKDDELDAALILCGLQHYKGEGRYCFQTTYVNECYHEYIAHRKNIKIIWVLRNPFSVVWSMVYNWDRFALNELYQGCGEQYHASSERNMFSRYFLPKADKLTKACLSYKGKTNQLFELCKQFSTENLLVIEYDDLILNSRQLLPKIYDFIDEPYVEKYSLGIHTKSIHKYNSFQANKRAIIEKHCSTIYDKALQLVLR